MERAKARCLARAETCWLKRWRYFVPTQSAAPREPLSTQWVRQGQFAAEFTAPEPQSWFNALVDGLDRLPRPAMAYGAIGLFVYAMNDPVGFAERMVGLAAVPDQLWWLLGAVVSFYFGAREMSHSRSAAPTPQALRQMVENIEEIRTLRDDSVRVAEDDTELEAGQGKNAALEAWRGQK